MKPIIIAIVGASGSGKTHLSKFLQKEFGIPAIISTTTRPGAKARGKGKIISLSIIQAPTTAGIC